MSSLTRVSLTLAQAQRLLAPLGDPEVVEVTRAATTNDVFRIVTGNRGNYYAKLHTARWYADQPDTFFVVERECAVHELLAKRGMPLPYIAWPDYTRTVVNRSVYICGELGGIPVTQAIRAHPDEMPVIIAALGNYLRRLHSIEFSRPGILCAAHAQFAPPQGPIPPVYSWDDHSMHHPEVLQREALGRLDRCRQERLLPESALRATEKLFARCSEIVRPNYSPPCFTVGNCHAYHFHVERRNGQWEVLGFYDFEAASAGDATTDFAELEAGLTPSAGSVAWREPFFAAYGRRPNLESHKIRILDYLLSYLPGCPKDMMPDLCWLRQHWMEVIDAREWDGLVWYPPTHLHRTPGIECCPQR